jgi:putative DNA primase/helicase
VSALPNICSAIADAETEFRLAMAARGLVPPRRLVLGRFGRCGTVERPHAQDGAYVLHLDGRPAGSINNMRDGAGWQKWRSDQPSPPVDWNAVKARQESTKLEREARYHAAAQRAAVEWEAATPATAHPYLDRKGVRSHGLRVSARGALVVPAYDPLNRLTTLEFILEDGRKIFLSGGRKAGSWFWVGKGATLAAKLLIAEGYGTAASLYEATGIPCAVAFDCGNLDRVACAIRKGWPKARVVVCADDDAWTDGNPGLRAAARAARLCGGTVATPVFGADRSKGDTDFNDLARLSGSSAVAACVAKGTK